jgi:hypothetical protein
VDGADTLILDTAVNDELLVSKGLDTVLEFEFLLIAFDRGGNLSSKINELEKRSEKYKFQTRKYFGCP